MTEQEPTPEEDLPADGDDAIEQPGEVVGSYTGTIVLRDPRGWDVSRANRPIVPAAPSVKELQEAIDKALTDLGYSVKVRLNDTRK